MNTWSIGLKLATVVIASPLDGSQVVLEITPIRDMKERTLKLNQRSDSKRRPSFTNLHFVKRLHVDIVNAEQTTERTIVDDYILFPG